MKHLCPDKKEVVNLNTDVSCLLLCETMLFIAIRVIVDQYKAHDIC
jgi:hypothetical protein